MCRRPTSPRSRRNWTRTASIISPSNFRKGCVSCTGIEFCNLAVAETKNRMLELIEQLEDDLRLVQGQDSHPLQRLPEFLRPASDRRHRLPRSAHQGERRDGRCLRRLHRRPARANRRFNELLKGKILAKDVHLFIDSSCGSTTPKSRAREPSPTSPTGCRRSEILAALDWK